MRNILKEGDKYVIYHSIRGKRYYYGRYEELTVARKVRDLLCLHNWGVKKDDGEYILYRRGRYEINKRINGKSKYFGCFASFDEAKRVRDELINNNWGEVIK